MTPAISNRQPTTAITAALQAILSALQVTIGTNAPVAAFSRVELFDSESLLEAFQLLAISEQRICLVVTLDEHFQTTNRAQTLITTRELPVALLVSDRILGDRTTALYGDDTTPGAWGLLELVLPAVMGMLIAPAPPLSGVTSEPVNASVLIVKNQKEKQNLPGRAAVALELHCRGGNLQAALGPQPVL
jgi:hypothetical protein